MPLSRIPVIDRSDEEEEDQAWHEAARAFNESIRGVHVSLAQGDCQEAAEFFTDAGDWYADVVRFAEEGQYDETLLALWEERYKGAYDKLAKECELEHVEFNGEKR